MKFIQNYSEQYQQEGTSHNLMSYQVKKLNQNTIQQEEENTPGKRKNRSKNFFKLDRGFGEANSQNGDIATLNVKGNAGGIIASPYVVNG